MQTPLWVPLVVAGIGVVGALAGSLAGVLITQRRSDRLDVLLSRAEMYGTEGAARAARTAIESYVDMMISGKGAMPRSIERHDADMLAFREAMRPSLGIETHEPVARLDPESLRPERVKGDRAGADDEEA